MKKLAKDWLEVVTTDGVAEPCLRLDHTGISPFILMIDGLPLVRFPGRKKMYVRLCDVEDWYKKEVRYMDSDERRREAAILLGLRARITITDNKDGTWNSKLAYAEEPDLALLEPYLVASAERRS